MKQTASPTPDGGSRLSQATARRLSLYLRHLEALRRDGVGTVSSGRVGRALGVTDAQVRRDLAALGNLGHPGVGYAVGPLVDVIRATLGINRPWSAALVGVGNLGRALMRYPGFRRQGFHIVALFDADPAQVGQQVEGMTVLAGEGLAGRVRARNVELGVICVPGPAAQGVADRLVEGGVRGLLNFAPALLQLPPSVRVVSVDLTVQLEQLAFQVQFGG